MRPGELRLEFGTVLQIHVVVLVSIGVREIARVAARRRDGDVRAGHDQSENLEVVAVNIAVAVQIAELRQPAEQFDVIEVDRERPDAIDDAEAQVFEDTLVIVRREITVAGHSVDRVGERVENEGLPDTGHGFNEDALWCTVHVTCGTDPFNCAGRAAVRADVGRRSRLADAKR